MTASKQVSRASGCSAAPCWPATSQEADRSGRNIASRAGADRNLGADGVERVAGIGAERADGRDADHNDQGQHDPVLDSRRAVFSLQKIHEKLTHDMIPFLLGG